jgi:lipoprotein-anchoring transpeptidase ErfK/SrfK
MLRYEPYLTEKKGTKKEGGEAQAAPSKPDAAADAEPSRSSEPAKKAAAEPAASSEDGGREGRRSAKRVPGDEGAGDDARAREAVAAVAPVDTATEEAEGGEGGSKPWWQTDKKKPSVSLADLERDADGNLAKRMVKGFFVAVDKSFGWNDRLWYRTTGGLVAPADRMYINKPPESKGVDWPEGAKLVGFVLSDKARKYELSSDGKAMKDAGKLALRSAVGLTGEAKEVGGAKYLRTLDGSWVKSQQCAVTEPGTRPSDVAPDEKWVDVDLSSKTLVLFVGDEPVYAALVSPGKRSRDKKKDHATPTGSWRIREKHVTVTMDGDGASGDLPYSIEDVPFVAYYKGSYALHGAFWHSNFGREMSHGCVNLSPRDARVVFDFVEPRLPKGWHAVWATKAKPGSLVVVHD